MTEPRDNTRRIGDGTLFWGGAYVLPEFATNNFLVAGTIGSGKTITLNLLLKCVMPSLRPGSDARLLVYDPKTEVLSHLRDMGARVPTGEGADLSGPADGPQVHILNPFDRRSARELRQAPLR